MTSGARYLADGNVLIALAVQEHVHHLAATTWFAAKSPLLATSAITQGSLLRYLLRSELNAPHAAEVLESITSQPWREFWPDSLPYQATTLRGVIGHRQVTDAYLADLAASHDARVATFDRGLTASRPNHTELIPT